MYKVVEFFHNVDGQEYKFIVEYVAIPPVTNNTYAATCPTDVTGEYFINDVIVFDKEDNNVTDCVAAKISDAEIWEYIDSQMDEDYDMDMLTEFNIFEDAEEYYGE